MSKLMRITSPLLIILAVAFLISIPRSMPTSARHIADELPAPTPPPVAAMAAAAAVVAPPAPVSTPRDWSHLRSTIAMEMEWFPGSLSVIAEDLTTGERFSFNTEATYHPASTMKVAVALCVAEALDWEERVALEAVDLDPEETTELDELPLGTTFAVQELIHLSLGNSSNVATHMLIRQLTPERLLDCSTRMGGPVTRGPEGSTPVTVETAAAWWRALWSLRQVDPARAEVLLEAMRGAEYTGRIQAGTPAPELVTHKFGSVEDYFHDGAIVWAEKPYLLVVLTGGAGEGEADWVIERVAAAGWADGAGRWP